MTRFDYVIVGAGPAGCVLANRLSEDPGVNVLLVEAGDPRRQPAHRHAHGVGELLGNPATAWHYPTRPFGPSQQVEYWVRGKTLGGSSSGNGMVYNRGNRADYDALERLGAGVASRRLHRRGRLTARRTGCEVPLQCAAPSPARGEQLRLQPRYAGCQGRWAA